MAERTEGTTEIEARSEEIVETITDYESYPEWVDGIRSAEVLERDDRGRGTRVAFGFSAMGFSAAYTLAYAYEPDRVSWTTVEASGAVRDIRGEYELEPLNGRTRVTYRLGVDLAVALPAFVKRRADRAAIRTALEGLKRRVEG
ncbi:MAG TPA: SRPBCC family protein [Actinomycetota bacterium]|nr:SRPBCC family protein [Actinomycetota bacterium]